jgi:ferredoxin
MAKYKIEVDQATCIGCGACVATCPDFYEMKEGDSGEKAHAKKEGTDDLGCAKDSAEVCPVNAIHITEGEKKII